MLRADSCRAATWDDLRHKAGRGGRTTVDDRGKQSRARPDKRCSSPFAIQTFEAEAPATRCSQRRTRVATDTAWREFTTSLKSTPSTHAAREGACERKQVGQLVGKRRWSGSWSAMKIASGSWSAMTTAREQRKPLTNQGTTLQKTVCTALAGRD